LGAGSTRYGKLDDSISDIAVQSSIRAIESASIKPNEIEAGYISNVFGIADKQVHLGPVIMSNLGIADKPSLSIESACGSGSVSLREAFANKKLHRLVLNGQQLIFLIVRISFMKEKQVLHFQVYLLQWLELI
jgi:acetyl-CoA acetyltransferase